MSDIGIKISADEAIETYEVFDIVEIIDFEISEDELAIRIISELSKGGHEEIVVKIEDLQEDQVIKISEKEIANIVITVEELTESISVSLNDIDLINSSLLKIAHLENRIRVLKSFLLKVPHLSQRIIQYLEQQIANAEQQVFRLKQLLLENKQEKIKLEEKKKHVNVPIVEQIKILDGKQTLSDHHLDIKIEITDLTNKSYIGVESMEKFPNSYQIDIPNKIMDKILNFGETVGLKIEAAGVVVGWVDKDSKIIHIKDFLPSETKKRSLVDVNFSSDDWANFHNQIDKMDKQGLGEGSELEIVGWFHTHPDHGAFLSPDDLNVHEHFLLDYQFAMVYDPQRKELISWAGFENISYSEEKELRKTARIFGEKRKLYPIPRYNLGGDVSERLKRIKFKK